MLVIFTLLGLIVPDTRETEETSGPVRNRLAHPVNLN